MSVLEFSSERRIHAVKRRMYVVNSVDHEKELQSKVDKLTAENEDLYTKYLGAMYEVTMLRKILHDNGINA